MTTGDRIEVRRICANGHHGALVGEQDQEQPFEVDLDIYLDLDVAEQSDDLGATVDYGELTLAVVEIITTTRFSLLEALAGAIATRVLCDLRIDRVGVTLRKMRPPVPVVMGSAGVRLIRVRPI